MVLGIKGACRTVSLLVLLLAGASVCVRLVAQVEGRENLVSTAAADYPRVLSGFVIDFATKQPLAMATIHTPDAKRGTVTDEQGYFEWEVQDGDTELIVAFVGYAPQLLLPEEEQDEVLLQLTPGFQLDEVTVVHHRRRGGCDIGSQWRELTEEEIVVLPPELALYLQQALVFPNPSREPPQLHVTSPLPHQLRVQLFNSAGTLLWQQGWDISSGINTLDLDPAMGHHPAGAYYLYLKDENGQERILTLVKP